MIVMEVAEPLGMGLLSLRTLVEPTNRIPGDWLPTMYRAVSTLWNIALVAGIWSQRCIEGFLN